MISRRNIFTPAEFKHTEMEDPAACRFAWVLGFESGNR